MDLDTIAMDLETILEDDSTGSTRLEYPGLNYVEEAFGVYQ